MRLPVYYAPAGIDPWTVRPEARAGADGPLAEFLRRNLWLILAVAAFIFMPRVLKRDDRRASPPPAQVQAVVEATPTPAFCEAMNGVAIIPQGERYVIGNRLLHCDAGELREVQNETTEGLRPTEAAP